MPNDILRVSLRPKVTTQLTEPDLMEDFQNRTLRPILKMQHTHLVGLFLQGGRKDSEQIRLMPIQVRMQYITERMQKETPLRNEIIGMISGHFTSTEFDFYLAHYSEARRRIIQMAIQRIARTFL